VAASIEDELERYRARLFGYGLSLTGNREEAGDLLQECAVRALSARSVPDGEPARRAWLFRILRNAWIDQHRRRRVVELVELDEGRCDDHVLWSGERGIIDAIAVRQALARLPVAYREIVSLVDLVGFSYSEAAELVGVPIGTVMSRLSRARKALLKDIGSARDR
jgi:RNA polymerase sigma-70 factor, ECF subfamily